MSTAVAAFEAAMETSTDFGRDVANEIFEAAYLDMIADALASCPPWCDVDHSRAIRECMPQDTYAHRALVAEVHFDGRRAVDVVVEQWRSVETGLPTEAPKVCLGGDTDRMLDLTSGEARSLAAALIEAAAKLDEITR